MPFHGVWNTLYIYPATKVRFFFQTIKHSDVYLQKSLILNQFETMKYPFASLAS